MKDINSTPVASTVELFTQNPNDSVFELRYANWNKDLWMGSLPNSQFGDVATVNSIIDSSSAKGTVGGSAMVHGNMPVLFADKNGSVDSFIAGIRAGGIDGAPVNGQTVTGYPPGNIPDSTRYFFAHTI